MNRRKLILREQITQSSVVPSSPLFAMPLMMIRRDPIVSDTLNPEDVEIGSKVCAVDTHSGYCHRGVFKGVDGNYILLNVNVSPDYEDPSNVQLLRFPAGSYRLRLEDTVIESIDIRKLDNVINEMKKALKIVFAHLPGVGTVAKLKKKGTPPEDDEELEKMVDKEKEKTSIEETDDRLRQIALKFKRKRSLNSGSGSRGTSSQTFDKWAEDNGIKLTPAERNAIIGRILPGEGVKPKSKARRALRVLR